MCRNIRVVRCNYVVKVISNSQFFLGSTLFIVDFSHLGFYFPPFSLISNSARGVFLPIHPYASTANLYFSLLPSYIHLGPSERLGPSRTFFSHPGCHVCFPGTSKCPSTLLTPPPRGEGKKARTLPTNVPLPFGRESHSFHPFSAPSFPGLP